MNVLQQAFPAEFNDVLLTIGGAKKQLKAKAEAQGKGKGNFKLDLLSAQVEQALRVFKQPENLLKYYPKILNGFPKKAVASVSSYSPQVRLVFSAVTSLCFCFVQLDRVPRLIQLQREKEVSMQKVQNLQSIVVKVEGKCVWHYE